MNSFDIISIDTETGGTEAGKHSLLSIGCVRLSDMSSFYAQIRQSDLLIHPEAMRVNDLDVKGMDDKSLDTMATVDIKLRDWLRTSPAYNGRAHSIVPMGLNVGSFDMQFVKANLPKSAGILSYRSIDINTLVMADALMRNVSYNTVKRAAKEVGRSYALDKTQGLGFHHALFDAWSNVGMFHYLVDEELTLKSKELISNG